MQAGTVIAAASRAFHLGARAAPVAWILVVAGCAGPRGGSPPPVLAHAPVIADSLVVTVIDSLPANQPAPAENSSRSAPARQPERRRPVAPRDPSPEITTIGVANDTTGTDSIDVSRFRVTSPMSMEAKTKLDRQISHDLLATRDHLRKVAPSRLTPEQTDKIRYVENLMARVGELRPTDLEGAALLARKAMLISRELAQAR
jgi:hypothetical protein